MAQYNEEIEQYLKETAYIEKLGNTNTYHLLMSGKIKKVTGISSSVLYEAQFFGKEVEYLYKPLFKIDEEFSLETFVSIFHNYYNPYFWADVLSAVTDTDKGVEDKIWFEDTSNKLRNITHNYYGYQVFNENCRMKSELNGELNNQIHQCIDNTDRQLREEIRLLVGKTEIKFKYGTYKILSKLTFGKTKKRYTEKTSKYKQYLETIKRF